MNLRDIQQHMADSRIDAWLLYDFRASNPVLARLLPGDRWTTRRVFLLIPARAQPVLLVHAIDASQFRSLPPGSPRTDVYLSWTDMREWLRTNLAGLSRVATEYSPGGMLPAVSITDGGTIDLLRALGAEVVSSADLIQVSIATWSDEARAVHEKTSATVTRIKDDAFALIGKRLASESPVTEHDVQSFILDRFQHAGLQTADAPVVAVNHHSADPHFEVSADNPAPIRRGDWLLIDLWARSPGDDHIFSDITWVAYLGDSVPPRHREVFNTVKAARDAALSLARSAWATGAPLAGWQLDDAARSVLIKAGFQRFIRHRTGHSLSPGPKVHGLGVNLDNLETHDTRAVLPGVGYTIEPGLYLPAEDGGFGVRLEINVYTDPASGPVVTSCIQDDVVLIR